MRTGRQYRGSGYYRCDAANNGLTNRRCRYGFRRGYLHLLTGCGLRSIRLSDANPFGRFGGITAYHT